MPPRKPLSTPPPRTRKEADPARGVTSERIAADLVAFRKAGGRIEVLGVTRVLTHLDAAGPAPAAATPAPAVSRSKRVAR